MSDSRDPAELLHDAAGGDRTAWHELESRFGARMWALARSCGLGEADAADAVQGAWLRLLQHMHDIRDPARVGGWLMTTTRREALLLLRKEPSGLLVRGPAGEASFGAVEEPDPASAVLEADGRRLLWKSVSALQEPCRTLLQLVATDLGNQQMAMRLGLPLGSVGPTRARCLEKLRTLLSLQETAQ
ncbi:MAG: sigma-70 family RNA polymerase sigma factor [Nonomuraea sp.]|nr:sigma-70 family RNA polymerase sigma factor [Nonomuraea sp.]NUP65860.1 sigma-70 family RNA polymerase sigma factor [Nonomuraea sp.]NUP81223.1 sigma-70 family RNA polymerase sigma factor [Nonomuraea sp.]NUS08378.1 sigma-70 family RNA polymerase sigma factor [Nonomuraea sp.]NUT45356.1 sigma-70 family RNA polymerase sigma factor [Thermoactinospora sp.]